MEVQAGMKADLTCVDTQKLSLSNVSGNCLAFLQAYVSWLMVYRRCVLQLVVLVLHPCSGKHL